MSIVEMVALQRAVVATHQLLMGDSHCPQIAGLLQGAKPPLLAMSAAQHPLQWISRGLQQQREVGQPIRTLHLIAHGRRMTGRSSECDARAPRLL